MLKPPHAPSVLLESPRSSKSPSLWCKGRRRRFLSSTALLESSIGDQQHKGIRCRSSPLHLVSFSQWPVWQLPHHPLQSPQFLPPSSGPVEPSLPRQLLRPVPMLWITVQHSNPILRLNAFRQTNGAPRVRFVVEEFVSCVIC